VELHAASPDEGASLAVLGRDEAEAVLVPVGRPAGDRGLGVRRIVGRAAEVPRVPRIGVPAAERRRIVQPEAAEEQAIGLADEVCQ
jgi:hypothetical protein